MNRCPYATIRENMNVLKCRLLVFFGGGVVWGLRAGCMEHCTKPSASYYRHLAVQVGNFANLF